MKWDFTHIHTIRYPETKMFMGKCHTPISNNCDTNQGFPAQGPNYPLYQEELGANTFYANCKPTPTNS